MRYKYSIASIKGLGWLVYLKDGHAHEVVVILLSELFTLSKMRIMKELINKISIHLMFSGLLISLGCMIIDAGGQAIPLDRLFQLKFDCSAPSRLVS